MLVLSLIALLARWLIVASTVACPYTTTKPTRSLVPLPLALTFGASTWRPCFLLLAVIALFSSEPVPLFKTATHLGDLHPFSLLPCCSYKILRFFLQLSTFGHIFMICFLLYYLFILGCLQFPQIMGCILVFLYNHFLPFSSITCWKVFMLLMVSMQQK